jgi:hypothetical protein
MISHPMNPAKRSPRSAKSYTAIVLGVLVVLCILLGVPLWRLGAP